MKRIWMVAEDDPVLRSILKMMLTLWEVDSLVFADGNEAWEWLDAVERGDYALALPEVALLDIRMPGHLGHEVGQRMRAVAATRDIPLLIMTAYHLSEQDKALIYETARPDHLVPKPFPSLDEFRSLIEAVIAGSRLSLEATPPSQSNTEMSGPTIAEQRWNSTDTEQNGFSLLKDKWGDG
jgi:DNA-binding response OmpR family regulator